MLGERPDPSASSGESKNARQRFGSNCLPCSARMMLGAMSSEYGSLESASRMRFSQCDAPPGLSCLVEPCHILFRRTGSMIRTVAIP